MKCEVKSEDLNIFQHKFTNSGKDLPWQEYETKFNNIKFKW